MSYEILLSLEILTMAALVVVIIVVAYQQFKKPNKSREADFVALASHQLRTPLTIMRGYISMLLDGDFGKIENKRQEAAMTAVYQANERLLRLVENMLGVSQLESKKNFHIEKEMFNVSKLATELVEEMKHKASVKNLELSLQIAPQLKNIHADELMMRQVILNLLDNAIKYTKRGNIILQMEEKNNLLQCSVVDTGPGIDKKYLIDIFEKFERRDVPDNNQEGFGLGLYACKLIVEAHHGRIWAESRGKDFGFKVSFEIPI